MPQTRFFRISLGLIFVLLIIYLLFLDSFLFAPIARLFNILILPLTLAGFFYYLFRPIISFLHHRGMKRWAAVTLLYLAIIGLFVLFGLYVWPKLVEQTTKFIDSAPKIMENIDKEVEKTKDGGGVVADVVPDSNEIRTKVAEYAQQAGQWASDYLATVIAYISRMVVIIGVVPVLLFFMLKDGRKLEDVLLHLVPRKYKKDAAEALKEIDDALSSFIVSRVVLNVILGALMYIGFLIIGLPYSLLLVLIAIVLNFIPYVGAILSAVPILTVAFLESPSLALWALLIILVAQQIQDHILTPIIFGKTMQIHPVTIIVLLLVGGDVAGVLGMLLALPFYIVVKILLVHIYKLFFEEKVEEIVE